MPRRKKAKSQANQVTESDNQTATEDVAAGTATNPVNDVSDEAEKVGIFLSTDVAQVLQSKV